MLLLIFLLLPSVVLANSTDCQSYVNESDCLANCSCIYCYGNSTNLCVPSDHTICEHYSYADNCHKSNSNNNLLYLFFLFLALCPLIIVIVACASRSGTSGPIIVAV